MNVLLGLNRSNLGNWLALNAAHIYERPMPHTIMSTQSNPQESWEVLRTLIFKAFVEISIVVLFFFFCWGGGVGS